MKKAKWKFCFPAFYANLLCNNSRLRKNVFFAFFIIYLNYQKVDLLLFQNINNNKSNHGRNIYPRITNNINIP